MFKSLHILGNSPRHYLPLVWGFPIVFQSVYGFTLWQSGLSFLGLLVGMILAVLSDPFWRFNYARLERNHQAASEDRSEFYPEWRLPSGTCPTFARLQRANQVTRIYSYRRSAFGHCRTFHLCLDDLFKRSLDRSNNGERILRDWVSVQLVNKSKLDLMFWLYRTMLVYTGIFTFLVDAYPKYATSALAANSFARSTFAGIFPLFGTQSKSKHPETKVVMEIQMLI